MADTIKDVTLSAVALSDKIIDDGKGGELLEITESTTIAKDALLKQKAAIATWRDEAIAKHTAKLDELAEREAEIDTKIAKFKIIRNNYE